MKTHSPNYYQLAEKIKQWGKELGFQQVGISDIDLSEHEESFKNWLANGFHGEMEFMAQHGSKRYRPAELLPGTVSIVTVRLNYLPESAGFAATLENPERAYISRYALGRDYHKVVRNKLKKLGQKIAAEIDTPELTFRPFVDSAPVMERSLAEKSGLGWTGKHTLTINREAGSWFFLGELFLPIELPTDQPVTEECGKCVACLTACPTGAIVEPYVVDSRKCISYLTIELKGAIPEEYRKAIGNRIYGCDDCQLICPWSREGQITEEQDFTPRKSLLDDELLTLWNWDENTFLSNTEGSPIRRIGYLRWLRNIAVALGNAPFSVVVIEQLKKRLQTIDPMLDEHITWAIEQQETKGDELGVVPRKLQRLIKAVKIGMPRDA